MSTWLRICSAKDCPPGQGREAVAGDRLLAIFNVEGQFHAIDGFCPHQGGPLGKGRLEGDIVTCPWHGWQVDVRTGQYVNNPALRHPTLPLRVEGADVWADVG